MKGEEPSKVQRHRQKTQESDEPCQVQFSCFFVSSLNSPLSGSLIPLVIYGFLTKSQYVNLVFSL